ncbi:MAG: hypothetical protein JWP78_3701 [Mucilaginibacter sp.]|nr:hypothetical protein [Mucilaginibacter sp.]
MKRLTTIALIALAFTLGACKKAYFDINNNPNSSTNAYPGLVLTNALNGTAKNTTGSYEFYRFASPWIGYWNFSGAYSGFLEERSYNITSNYGGATNTWANLFNNLEDYYYLEQQGKLLGKPYFVGYAKTMKAFNFQYLVDFYGDVPYTQALQSTKFIRPKYDKDIAIYEDLAKQLDSAATIFKDNVNKVASSDVAYDIMYAGDLVKWGKLANTIKLRLLLRQSEIPGRTAYIKAEIAKIDANGLGYILAGETANVQPGYLNSDGKQNPFYSVFGYTAAAAVTMQFGHLEYLAAKYSLDFYQNNNDPRLGRFYTTINEGKGTTYVGHPFGPTATEAEKPDQISAIGPGLVSFPTDASKPQPLITDFESLFLQAEAAQRGLTTGDARALYQAAVTQSFIAMDLTAGDAATYLSSQPVANWDDPVNSGFGITAEDSAAKTDNKLILIIKQKWASLNGFNDIEAWCDYRRLGLPADIPISNNPAATTLKIPVRMPYPQSEYNYNPDNVGAEGIISQFNSRVFWDVK